MPLIPNTLLHALTMDDWERIAFYTVTSKSTFLGPPSGLCTLSLVCRHIHDVISITNNSHLFAKIFCFKFDYTAPMRRLSERWLTSRCLASELVKRFTALGRIRQRSSLRHDDLWTCYLMMSENDGKNERQLGDWAGLRQYLESATLARMYSPPMWYTDPISDSLMSWLLWMTISRHSVVRSRFDQLILQIMHPFIVTGYQAASTYAPDSYFHLPICQDTIVVAPNCSGLLPPKTEIVHYSHKLILAVPLVTVAATLITTVGTEDLQTNLTFPDAALLLPPDRATAIAVGAVGPTLEDITHFHFRERIHVRDRCPLITELEFDLAGDANLVTLVGSECHDEDWGRLVACHDPWIGSMPLRGKVFTLGSMAGSWAGRLMIPDIESLTSVILHPHESPFSISLQHKPLYWKLQEHHCLRADESLSSGHGHLDDDDFLNAWLPSGIVVKHLEDGIDVFDPNTGVNAHYETFRPKGERPYSELASGRIQSKWCPDTPEMATEGDSSSDSSNGASWHPGMSYIDDDEEYEDVVSHLSSGVCDILITGETGESHGDAWGHFTVVGRVRYWDGLIALLHTPRDPNDTHLGQWIFRGYLHDRNFVGRWRETSTPIGPVGFGGSFVVHNAEG